MLVDLYSIKTIKALLKEHGATPKDSLGQNFLLEKRVSASMIAAANLSFKDTVVEIGPGIGTLTQELSKTVKNVIAIEKDSTMVDILKKTTKDLSNIQIIQDDALNTKYKILNTRYKVVANLPYNIATPVVRMFLETKNKPECIVVMFQKEVAKRICAKSRMNLLAVSMQFYAKVEIIRNITRSSRLSCALLRALSRS